MKLEQVIVFFSMVYFLLISMGGLTSAYAEDIRPKSSSVLKERPQKVCGKNKNCHRWMQYASFLEGTRTYLKGSEYEIDIRNGCISYEVSKEQGDFSLSRGIIDERREVSCSRKISLKAMGSAYEPNHFFSVTKLKNEDSQIVYQQDPGYLTISMGNEMYMAGSFDIHQFEDRIKFIGDIRGFEAHVSVSFYDNGVTEIHPSEVRQGSNMEKVTLELTENQLETIKAFADSIISLFN